MKVPSQDYQIVRVLWKKMFKICWKRERDEESESDESDFDYHSDDAQTDQRKQCKIIANERGEILIENFEFYTGHNTIIL